jgi:hypothetical protein
MQLKEWSHREFVNFDSILKMLPKNTIKVEVSSWGPDQIDEAINKNLQTSKCILLTNDDVWRYTSYFKDKSYDGKIIVSTLGYDNVKYSDCYYELSFPAFYFKRKIYTDTKEKQKNLSYGFSCLNNRTSIDRILLGYNLFKENLIDNIIFSQNLFPDYDVPRNLNIFFEHPFIFEHFDFSKYNEYRSLLPIVASNEIVHQNEFYSDHTIQHDAYLKAYCNIVTESDSESWPYYVNENLPIITEKSYKPFLSKQIPLYLAAKGHLTYLQKYGFDTLNKFLPDNYNNFNTIEKIKAIVAIVKLGKEFVEDFYFSHLREINHNYELALSDKVETLIYNELNEFLHDI